jgi:glycosyltransferase involved in cell wall biosynthesis
MLAACTSNLSVHVSSIAAVLQTKPACDVVAHSFCVANPEILKAYPHARHVEIIVGSDLAPTPGVDRVYPSWAWLNFLWGKYEARHLGRVGDVMIPHWVNPSDWPLGAKTEDFLLFVGRLVPQKFGLLRAIARALPRQKIVVASAGDPREVAGIPNIDVIGFAAPNKLAGLMGKAKAVLCPSLYCEPFGLAAVEAGLTGAHVIASRVGGFVETLPPNSTLCNPNKLEDWLAAIASTACSNDERVKRRVWHMSHHSPEVIAPQYIKFLCAEKRSPVPVYGPRGTVAATLERV